MGPPGCPYLQGVYIFMTPECIASAGELASRKQPADEVTVMTFSLPHVETISTCTTLYRLTHKREMTKQQMVIHQLETLNSRTYKLLSR